jgi:hypothetical protein
MVDRMPKTGTGLFTEDEKKQIISDLIALKKEQIAAFLDTVGQKKTGTKEAIRERIENAVEDGLVSIDSIVHFVDRVIPWGKQHVYMFRGPKSPISDWRHDTWVFNRLKRHGMQRYLNKSLPLILPEAMQVSSIWHDSKRLRITAIKKRDWLERNEKYDSKTKTPEGKNVVLKAYEHEIVRSLVAFEWDLVLNEATLQIAQLPHGTEYSTVADEFFELTQDWIDRSLFTEMDLRRPIARLHELEEKGLGETRSQTINYRTMQGRRIEARSASMCDPLFGEQPIDTMLQAVRKNGVGQIGNFYWIPTGNNNRNPLTSDVHVIVVAPQNRINFPTPNDEPSVRYVLSRIRSHCN